jgi:hypothetical protein
MTNFLHMSARWPKLAAKVFELEHAQRLADLVCKIRRIGDANGGNLPGFPLPELVAPPLLPAVGNYDLISGDSSDDGKEMVPEGLSSRFVSGPRLLTERLLTEDEEQWTVMTLHKLIEHTPSNYHELELSDRTCLFRGVRVQWLFVVPLFQENLRVDLAMAETVWDLLFCTNSVTRSKALLDAGIMVPDNAGTRYSMRGARSFFQAVAAVLVLASGDVLCHCQVFHANVYCTQHMLCDGRPFPLRWEAHLDGSAVVVSRNIRDQTAEVVQHGSIQHMICGLPAAQRQAVRANGRKTPLRTLAPRRRLALQEDAAHDSLRLWQQYIDSIALTRQTWDVAQMCTLFSVPTGGRRNVCLVMCKEFLHYVKFWTTSRKTGSVCIDCSWKMNVCEWRAVAIGCMGQHQDPKAGFRHATGLPASIAFGPKDRLLGSRVLGGRELSATTLPLTLSLLRENQYNNVPFPRGFPVGGGRSDLQN